MSPPVIVVGIIAVGLIVLALLFADGLSPTASDAEAEVEPIDPSDPTAGFTGDEMQRAALDIISPVPDGSPSWIGGTVDEAERALERIAQMRAQYLDYQPRRMRHHIMDWLDYFEKKARENLEDCKTQKSRRNLDEYSERSDKERARVRELRDRLRESKRLPE